MRNQKKEEYERHKAERQARANDKYKTGLRRYFRWWRIPSDRFAFFLALATIFLVVVGGLQWDTLNRTDQTLKNAQRPWVAVTGVDTVGDGTLSDVNGTIAFDLHGKLTLNFILTAEIFGQTPAQHVFSRGKIVSQTPPKSDALFMEQKILCDEWKNRIWEVNEERTAFPNEKPRIRTLVETADGFASLEFARTEMRIVVVAGCVIYADQSNAAHQTGFVYRITKKDPANPRGMIPFGAGIMPISGFEFHTSEDGSGPAD